MKASYHKNAALLALLAERWPRCFALSGRQRMPLKVGIRDDIMAALDGAMTAGELNSAVRCYAANRHYQLALRTGAPRVDLDGTEVGSVTSEEAASAQGVLRSREVRAARRKAQSRRHRRHGRRHDRGGSGSPT